ncbi:MAG: DUF2804 domain-containing protein [Chrysiogenales bacterium]|nr:MAG: DUF2804 domain-containing protein [Chrysiogenales bacterium]
MYTIIGPDNRVRYGCIDEPVDFNYRDFRLLDFLGRETGRLRKRFAFHKFNYLGVITDRFIVGFAAVDLTYAHNVFAYLFDYAGGLLYEYDALWPGNARLNFNTHPDEYAIDFRKGATRLRVEKSHARGELSFDAMFQGRLRATGSAPYGLESHRPLRVLNPSEPTRWTFTEKRAGMVPDLIRIELDGKPLPFDLSKTTLVYDWSGGYLRRRTDWFWAAFSGFRGRIPVGGNIATLVNESCFNENAFWIGDKRTRVRQCVFDFDLGDTGKPWRVGDEGGSVDMAFYPEGERSHVVNAMVVKTAFHQMIGSFRGTLRPEGGKALKLDGVRGFTEYHRALW